MKDILKNNNTNRLGNENEKDSMSILCLDIGPYNHGEENEILDCFQECFGYEQSQERWRHIYLENPYGKTILMLAREKGAVIAQSAIHPRLITAFGKERYAGLGSWVMTRKQWRHKGLSRMLLSDAHKKASEQGYTVTYGFPNEKLITNVCKYQGYDVVSPLPVMIRPINFIRSGYSMLVKKRFGGQGNEGLTGKLNPWTNPSFDARHTELFKNAEAISHISIVRNEIYLKWRYPASPDSPYLQYDIKKQDTVEATMVIRPYIESGIPLVLIMEWLWRKGSLGAGLRLMREAIGLAHKTRVYGLAALAMPETRQRQLLWRKGFFRLPSALFPDHLTLTVRPNSGVEADYSRWLKPSNWYLTFGDGNTL